MSLTAVPVYLWTRSLARPAWALVAAALTVAVPGLAYSGLVMTEVAFYPALVLAAWALARALERPTLRRQSWLVAAAALAAMTRLQAFVLLPVFVTAVALKVILDRRPREALRLWPAAAGLGGLAARRRRQPELALRRVLACGRDELSRKRGAPVCALPRR
jgi:asparagine N-glycosylation enzyme membrane subunit Stt3